MHRLGDLVVPRGRDGRGADVVELAVVVVEPEQERRDRRSPFAFQRSPTTTQSAVFSGFTFATASREPGRVGLVAALRDDAVEPERLERVEPRERLVEVERERRQRQVGADASRASPGAPRAAPASARRRPRASTSKRDEAGRDLGRELAHAALRGMQAGLHRVEVERRRRGRSRSRRRSPSAGGGRRRAARAPGSSGAAAARCATRAGARPRRSRAARGSRPTSARTASRRRRAARGRAPPPSAGTGSSDRGSRGARPARCSCARGPCAEP